MNCIIVEDEPIAASIIEEYIQLTPALSLVGKCGDAQTAIEAMRIQSVDVLFLDIHLPGLKGLELLTLLPQNVQVILTTAYHQYAIESYELGVVDYLLKPIEFSRFQKAVQKLRPKILSEISVRKFHFFNVNKSMVRVWIDEIIAVESLREYITIWLMDGSKITTKLSLSQMQKLLSKDNFLQIHRSFLIAIHHIKIYSATEVTVGSKTIPIGRLYKDEFVKLMVR